MPPCFYCSPEQVNQKKYYVYNGKVLLMFGDCVALHEHTGCYLKPGDSCDFITIKSKLSYISRQMRTFSNIMKIFVL